MFPSLKLQIESSYVGDFLYYSRLHLPRGLPGGSAGKESACHARDQGLIPVLGRSPGGGHGNPLQYSCLENPHGQRSLAGCSPWRPKESDTTERLCTAPSLSPTEPPAAPLHTSSMRCCYQARPSEEQPAGHSRSHVGVRGEPGPSWLCSPPLPRQSPIMD